MFTTLFESKLNRQLGTGVLVMLVVALGSYAYVTLKTATEWGGPTTIMITGTGEATAVPDIATFSFSVRGEGADAAAAQAKSAEAINAIMAFVKEQGVAEKDVQTSGYNMYPKFKYEQKPCVMGMYCPPGEQIADGFEVSQMVTVKVRETAKAGALLAGVGERGATDISGLTFTIDDEDALKAQARKAAIEDAQAQAAVLADQLGVRLGDMTSYYEETPMPYYGGMGGDMMMSAKAEMAPTPEIAVGEGTVTAKVNLTYEIK